ncbi:MAG: formylglycine-generating enzyme family protein [bacterium]|nr:formylglycine-generating enzyme family protein [bacterium]
MRARRLTAMLALVAGLVLFGAGAPAMGFALGDWNTNGVIDLDDYSHLPVCLTGPGGGLGAGCEVFDFDSDTDVDLYDFARFRRVFGTSVAVVIDTVTIGNPENDGELSGAGAGGHGADRICGAVGYTYNIGKYEVTAGQYAEFLNAVAASDPYGLYGTDMDSSSYGCQITQIGSNGSYTYDFSGRPSGTEDDWANRPVNYVSWGDAARFANWLHNGQPTGAQDLTTTEDGSYFLDGATSSEALMLVTREPDATWVIPSEDEWYKAAYHMNDGVTGNYWEYPMGSNAVPDNGNPGGDTGNSANFFDGNYAIGGPYWRTEVGYFGLSDSPYGTFDQGGNVWEWDEAILNGSYRGRRGGSRGSPDGNLLAASRYNATPTNQNDGLGFRVAEVP